MVSNGLLEWRAAARRRLPRFVFDYLEGGADDEACMLRNRAALDSILLVPRVLRDVTSCSTCTDLFGAQLACPVIIAPIGLSGLFWKCGDLALARAAFRAGIPFVLSSAATSTIEQVSDANPGINWFQLYVFGERRIAESMIDRARDAGFKALVLTVDTPISGNRERDRRNGFALPLRHTPRLLFDLLQHPRWLMQLLRCGMPQLANLVTSDAASTEAQAALLSRAMDRSLTWRSVAWLRSRWPGPLVLKGVLSPADVRLARDNGLDGIIVSNHGGRQLDAAPATMDALGAAIDIAAGQLAVMVDSGFRRGSDVVRALAIGANAVLVGRPVIYGLAAAGEAGAYDVLMQLIAEVARTLTLLGVKDVGDLDAGFIKGSSRSTPRP